MRWHRRKQSDWFTTAAPVLDSAADAVQSVTRGLSWNTESPTEPIAELPEALVFGSSKLLAELPASNDPDLDARVDELRRHLAATSRGLAGASTPDASYWTQHLREARVRLVMVAEYYRAAELPVPARLIAIDEPGPPLPGDHEILERLHDLESTYAESHYRAFDDARDAVERALDSDRSASGRDAGAELMAQVARMRMLPPLGFAAYDIPIGASYRLLDAAGSSVGTDPDGARRALAEASHLVDCAMLPIEDMLRREPEA